MSEQILVGDESPDGAVSGGGAPLDPLGDAEVANVKNRAKVGSARPSALLYTYGPGSVMDLPGLSVMPAGLDDWDRIWARRPFIPTIVEPRLLDVVRLHLGPQVDGLRPYPWQPKVTGDSSEGSDLGVPARVFPQWLRCTGCDFLAPISRFTYTNTHPFRPDLAGFAHKSCPGRRKGASGGAGKKSRPAVPAPHLLTCTNGHADEFPYDLWVHRGETCDKAELPDLRMRDASFGKSTGAAIECAACGKRRNMSEAQGPSGRAKLPNKCRGRHPHLNIYEANCKAQPTLILMGASNLWFSSTQTIIVMPRTDAQERSALGDRLRAELGMENLTNFGDKPEFVRALAGQNNLDLSALSDEDLGDLVRKLLEPPSDSDRQLRLASWDPAELLVPEWEYLQRPSLFPKQLNSSGLMVTEMAVDPSLLPQISRVVAVDKMKRVNAFIGFTRLDAMDRAGDLSTRLVKLTADGRPKWVPATEDRGEGIFIQFDLNLVADWESKILASPLWEAHTQAHRRNFYRRFSETAHLVDPDTRMPAPRFWMIHSFSHALIREMAMRSGYGAASLSERIYAWPKTDDRPAAAGVFIGTTASDSEGTLGGLVALAAPKKLASIVQAALRRTRRCSSDPVCAMRTPSDPEDFLHGAACHCCSFVSETSCEKANHFLDRRFVLTLPAADVSQVPGFFRSPDVV
jgi:hypothetical protein